MLLIDHLKPKSTKIDPAKFKSVKDVARKDILFGVARVPNSGRLFLASSDFSVHEIDMAAAKPEDKALAKHDSYVTCVVTIGKYVISGSYDGKLIWWDLEKGAVVRTLEAHTKFIRGLVLSPDGSLVASVGDDMVCRLWDPMTGEKKRELRGHQEKTPTHFNSMLYVAAFSPDGTHLATADRIGAVIIWETATGKQLAKLDAKGLYTWDAVQRIRSIGGVRSLAFSPDGKLLAAGGVGHIGNVDGLDGPARVEIYDWAKGEMTNEFKGPNGMVNRLAFHPKGDWLLALSGGDSAALFLDLKTKKILNTFKVPFFMHAAAFNEAFDTVYAVGHNKVAMFEMKG